MLPLIPFGTKVRHRPAATDPRGNAKLDPMGVVGVFLGYVKDEMQVVRFLAEPMLLHYPSSAI